MDFNYQRLNFFGIFFFVKKEILHRRQYYFLYQYVFSNCMIEIIFFFWYTFFIHVYRNFQKNFRLLVILIQKIDKK